jgi:hypothetical protein
VKSVEIITHKCTEIHPENGVLFGGFLAYFLPVVDKRKCPVSGHLKL